MTVTQSYSDIQQGGQDYLRCQCDPNMVPGEVITTAAVAVPDDFSVIGGVKIGTVSADGKVFTEDPAGWCLEALINVGNAVGYRNIVWTANIDGGTRIIPVTFGIVVTPRS